jgi:hypothetical protein
MHVSELGNQPHLAETAAGRVIVLFFKNGASAAEIVEFICSLKAVMLKNEALVMLSASSLLSPANFTRSSSTLTLTTHKHT